MWAAPAPGRRKRGGAAVYCLATLFLASLVCGNLIGSSATVGAVPVQPPVLPTITGNPTMKIGAGPAAAQPHDHHHRHHQQQQQHHDKMSSTSTAIGRRPAPLHFEGVADSKRQVPSCPDPLHNR